MNRLVAFEKSVGGVVFRIQEDKILYLLVQYRSWQWDFPKGHTEKGENDEQTLRRELFEETGISEIKIMPNFSKNVYYFYRAKGNERKERQETKRGINIFKRVIYFAVETNTKDVKIDFENKDFAWLSFEDAKKRIGNSDSRRVLTLVNQVLEKRKD